MNTVADILNLAASYMGRTTSDDFNPSNLSTAGPNIDLGIYALNAARKTLERMHDFKYAELNAYLAIGSSGGSLADAYVDGTVTVSGSLTPNVAGTFTLAGTHNALPFYTRTVSSTTYFLSYSGTAWTITPGGFSTSGSYWGLTTASTSPAGSYTAHTYTGTATVTVGTAGVSIKRVATVALPVSGGYWPIEFLSNDEWLGRLRRGIGRQAYDSSKTLSGLGVATNNPLAYQNGQIIYLWPETLTLPITAQLNAVRWMPDYTAGTDTDFFTQFGHDALLWHAVLSLNKMWRRFVDRQEQNVDEAAVQKLADEAAQAMIAWDVSTARGTSTPAGQQTPDYSNTTSTGK